MSAARAKGTAAETRIVAYLRTWWPHAERRAPAGARDRGDIAGILGIVIEVKNQSRDCLPKWVDEANTEADNDGAGIAAVWHKRRGVTDPGRWFVTMNGQVFVQLLIEAGYTDGHRR